MSLPNGERRCKDGEKRRDGNICCRGVICTGQGFEPCNVHNGTDNCVPCPEGEYLDGTYSTDRFDSSPCALIPPCDSEKIRDENGHCVCDRSRGYYRKESQDGICHISEAKCNNPGQELGEIGECSPCKPGFYKNKNGLHLCQRQSNITCPNGHVVVEGNKTTDKHCIAFETTASTTSFKTLEISTPKPDNDNSGIYTAAVLGIGGVVLLGFIIIFVIKKLNGRRETPRQSDYEMADPLQGLGEHHPDEPSDDEPDDQFQNTRVKTPDISIANTIREDTAHYDSGGKDLKDLAIPIDDDEPNVNQPYRTRNDDIPFADYIIEEGAVGGEAIVTQRDQASAIPNREQYPGISETEVNAHVHGSQFLTTLGDDDQISHDDSGRLVIGPNSCPLPNNNGDDINQNMPGQYQRQGVEPTSIHSSSFHEIHGRDMENGPMSNRSVLLSIEENNDT